MAQLQAQIDDRRRAPLRFPVPSTLPAHDDRYEKLAIAGFVISTLVIYALLFLSLFRAVAWARRRGP